jgi:outer membrane protein TolC
MPLLALPSPHATHTIGSVMTIHEAVLLALRNSPDIQSAELARVTDKYALIVAKHSYLPQFTFGGSVSADVDSVATSTVSPIKASITNSPLGITGNLNYDPVKGTMGLTVDKKLLAGGSYITNMDSLWTAEETEKENRLAYRDAVVTVIHNTTQAYRTVVTDKLTLAADQSDLDSDLEQLKDAKLKLSLGRGTENDVNQSQLDIAQAKSTIITDKQTLLSDRAAFNTVLGLDQNIAIHISNISPIPHIHMGSLHDAVQAAFRTSTDYQKAKILVTQDKRALEIAKNAALPSLDYEGVGSLGGRPGESSFKNTLTWGIPIDDVGAKAKIVNARIALINAQQDLINARNTLISTMTLDYNALKNSINSLKLANMSLGLNETTVKQQEAQYQAGQLDLYTLSTAKQGLTKTRNDLQGTKDALWSDLETFRKDTGTVLSSWHITLNY